MSGSSFSSPLIFYGILNRYLLNQCKLHNLLRKRIIHNFKKISQQNLTKSTEKKESKLVLNFTLCLTCINKLGSKWWGMNQFTLLDTLPETEAQEQEWLCLGFHGYREIDDVVPRCHISFAYSIPARALRRTIPCQLLTRPEFVKTLGLTCLLSFYSVV